MRRSRDAVQVGIATSNYPGMIPNVGNEEDSRIRFKVTTLNSTRSEIWIKEFGLVAANENLFFRRVSANAPIAPSQVPTILGEFYASDLANEFDYEGEILSYVVMAQRKVAATTRLVLSYSSAILAKPEETPPPIYTAKEWAIDAQSSGLNIEFGESVVTLTLPDDETQLFRAPLPLREWYQTMIVIGGAGSDLSLTWPTGGCDVDLRNSNVRGVNVERMPYAIEVAMGNVFDSKIRPKLHIARTVNRVEADRVWLELKTQAELQTLILRDSDVLLSVSQLLSKPQADRGELEYEPARPDDFIPRSIGLLAVSGANRLSGAWRVSDLQVPEYMSTSGDPDNWPRIDIRGSLNARRLLATQEAPAILRKPISLSISSTSEIQIDWIAPNSKLETSDSVVLGYSLAFQHWSFAPWSVRSESGSLSTILRATVDDIWKIENLQLLGGPEVEVRGRVEGLSIPAAGGHVARLKLGRGARANSVSGDCVMSMEPRAQVSGSRKDPIRVHNISGCRDAQLDFIDTTRLDIDSLTEAQEAARFTVCVRSIHRRPSSRETEAASGLQMERRNVPKKETRRSTALFLFKLAPLSRSCGMPAATVREVEFRYLQARRRSLPISLERLLLSLFALTGYGRRIIRPVLLYLTICALIGLGLSLYGIAKMPAFLHAESSLRFLWVQIRWGTWWNLTWRTALEPLVLLRLIKPEAALNPVGLVQNLASGLSRAAGVALIGFSLLGVKRLYSYREDKSM